VQNELELIFWARPPEANGSVFGIGIPAERIAALVRELFPEAAAAGDGTCLAILDENARPVITSAPGFEAAWRHPFVASEIGEALPHWEAALYLLEPDALSRSARLVTLSLTLLIALALAAILAGGYFVAIDARRQLALAQKKTDFVSNVSHELKTPLTSIRMFAELLQQCGADDPARRAKYLRIITLESERLTRLINNVLDFARIEKKHKNYHKSGADLFPVIERVWEAQAEHLAEAGFTSQWHADDPPYPVHADPDAISQVVVNLLSNAEKYSTERKDVTLHTWKENGSLCVAVLDRGDGIPAGEERKIFEAFYRCDDSLASGVQGSGLGLTLARRIAQDHGGSIEVRPRAGGGSEFTLRLPLQPQGAP
jgi:signal transduction histidine kinase